MKDSATSTESVQDSLNKRGISRFPANFRRDFQVGNFRFAHALPEVQRSTSSSASTTARLMRMRNKINPILITRFHERFQDFPGDFQISQKISGFPRRFQARCTRYPQVPDPSRNSCDSSRPKAIMPEFIPIILFRTSLHYHLSFMPIILLLFHQKKSIFIPHFISLA